jgi:amino acid transporter
LASVFVSIGGGQTSVQEAYDIMVNLTILVYFVPYLYVFASFLALRKERSSSGDESRIQVPGGRGTMWAVAGVGLTATAISIALVMVPPVGTENSVNYEVNVIGQAALLLAIGMALFYSAKGRRNAPQDLSASNDTPEGGSPGGSR